MAGDIGNGRKAGITALFASIIFFDQLTKFFALKYLDPGEPVQIVPGLLNLHLIYNPGAAFGAFASLTDGTRRLALAVVTIVAVLIVVHLLLNSKNDAPSQFSLSAILGGAIGNVIDRIRFDSVVDFLDFYISEHHWPAFNVADSAISLGVVCLVIRMLTVKDPAHGGLSSTKEFPGKNV